MRFVDGLVAHDAAAVADMPAEDRRALGRHVVEVLATLHGIDPDAVGLGDLGRREAYLARQLPALVKAVGRDPDARGGPRWRRASACCGENMPEQVGASIAHGGLSPRQHDRGRAGASGPWLDWELCTLGDALADLGYLLNNWMQPGEPGAVAAPTGAGGIRVAGGSVRGLCRGDGPRPVPHRLLPRVLPLAPGGHRPGGLQALPRGRDGRKPGASTSNSKEEGVNARARTALAFLT